MTPEQRKFVMSQLKAQGFEPPKPKPKPKKKKE